MTALPFHHSNAFSGDRAADMTSMGSVGMPPVLYDDGCARLTAALVRQAVKDGASWLVVRCRAGYGPGYLQRGWEKVAEEQENSIIYWIVRKPHEPDPEARELVMHFGPRARGSILRWWQDPRTLFPELARRYDDE